MHIITADNIEVDRALDSVKNLALIANLKGCQMRNIIELTGNNFEIGEQLGKFWGDYFERHRSKGHPIIDCYLQWLSQDLPRQYEVLFSNTEKHFPDLIKEIEGMASGVNNSNLKTSKPVTREQIFVRCLWEEKRSCTSVIFKTADGYSICHNMEDDAPDGLTDGVFPLCIAKINLNNGCYHKFISFSYPFGLLGTLGVNRWFAFQGNSIGNHGKSKRWHHRIPYSVFQRKLLEMTSEVDIKMFLAEHHIPIPGHNYIVFHDRAYSLEIRPQNICKSQLCQYKLIPRHSPWHVHTNYFRNTVIDKNWLHGNECTCDWRFEKLNDFCIQYPDNITATEITKFFTALALVNSKYTSGFTLIKVSNNSTTCSGEVYFDKTESFYLDLS